MQQNKSNNFSDSYLIPIHVCYGQAIQLRAPQTMHFSAHLIHILLLLEVLPVGGQVLLVLGRTGIGGSELGRPRHVQVLVALLVEHLHGNIFNVDLFFFFLARKMFLFWLENFLIGTYIVLF